MRKNVRSAEARSTFATSALLFVSAACTTGDASRADSAGRAQGMADSANGVIAPASAVGMKDSDMASFVAVSDMYASEAGRVASTRARDAGVRALGSEMSTEHEASLQQIRQLANANQWIVSEGATPASGKIAPRVPSAEVKTGQAGGTSGSLAGTISTQDSAGAIGLSADTTSRGALAAAVVQLQLTERDLIARLRNTPRASFDTAYINSQLIAHQQALDIVRQYTNSVQNAELRSQLQDLEARIQRHLSRIEEARARITG